VPYYFLSVIALAVVARGNAVVAYLASLQADFRSQQNPHRGCRSGGGSIVAWTHQTE
jgi:hypothetical protein